MSREPKPNRFHTPFAKLKGLAATRAQAHAESQARAAAARQQQQQRAQVAAQDAAHDAQVFLRAVAGAVPLRASVPRQAPDPTVERVHSSDDELVVAELHNLVQGQGAFRVHESEEVFFGLAPGVNLQLLAQLQEGHFAYHRHIDLHGLGRQDAHLAVNRFVATARRDAERCVLIITGRGKSSPGGLSVLRGSLPRWLSRAPCRAHVLAFCTAQAIDGGPGAFYVLLRRPGVKPFGESLLP